MLAGLLINLWQYLMIHIVLYSFSFDCPGPTTTHLTSSPTFSRNGNSDVGICMIVLAVNTFLKDNIKAAIKAAVYEMYENS